MRSDCLPSAVLGSMRRTGSRWSSGLLERSDVCSRCRDLLASLIRTARDLGAAVSVLISL